VYDRVAKSCSSMTVRTNRAKFTTIELSGGTHRARRRELSEPMTNYQIILMMEETALLMLPSL
jgi:hypothetical protein